MFSILEFCKFAGISRSLYYTLKSRNEGPAETRILGRVGINKETAAEWLKAQEGKIAA
jgi:predicted DNA-binding transcriptional regulator AlpA